MGDHAAALPLCRQALEVTRAAVGEAHPAFAGSLAHLAELYREMGDHAAALPLFRQALEVTRGALGEAHPAFAACLNNLARLHLDTGNHASAEPLYRELVEICRTARGEQHPNFAAALINLAGLYQDRGDFAAAEPLYRQAQEVYRTALGEQHPAFAATLDSLATLAYEQGNLAQSEALYRQVLEIRLTTLGERHPDVPESLVNLAGILQVRGEFAAAEAIYQDALRIYREVWDNRHPGYHVCLNNLAMLYADTRNYRAARPLFEQVLKTVRATRGEHNPDYAKRLANLALTCEGLGDYAAAEPLLRQAWEIFRATVGERYPDSLSCLHSLSGLYHRMGDYATAISLCRQVLELRRLAQGERHSEVATCLNDLAVVCHDAGDHAAAELYSRQALETWRGLVGNQHAEYAMSLITRADILSAMGDHPAAESVCRQALEILQASHHDHHTPDLRSAHAMQSLASIYHHRGDYAIAESLCGRSVEILRKALGERHPDYLSGLNNLALCYKARDNYAAAEPLFRQVLDTRRAVLGERHPHTANSLNNLSQLCHRLGQHEASELLYRQALEIIRSTIGEGHRHYMLTLYNLANVYAAVGREAEALEVMQQAGTIQTRLIGQAFAFASERQRMAFLNQVIPDYVAFLSLLRRHFAQVSEAIAMGLGLVFRRKALGAEALTTQLDAVIGGRYRDQEPRLRELAALRQQIARKLLAGPGSEGVQAHQRQIDQWTTSKELLEADLARHIVEMNLQQRLQNSTPQAVTLGLPEGAALVEFVNYLDLNLHSFRYLAFILLSAELQRVQLIDLGEAEPIDRLIAAFRAAITGEAPPPDLTGEPGEPAVAADTSTGERLRAAVFDPLADILGSCRRLFLAPDGDLNRLPFGALPLADGRHLLDAYRLSYVSVGRDLLRFQVRSSREPAEPLVAADPDFDLAATAEATPPTQLATAQPAPRRGFWGRLFGRRPASPAQESAPQLVACPSPTAPAAGRLSRDFDRRQYHFSHLPGTRAEGERVGRRLGVPPLLAGAALEGRVKACRSPRILHLATHGFFLPDAQRDLNRLGRNLEFMSAGDAPGLGRLSGPGMENPMLRSGLALAGANTFLRGAPLPAEAEDGLLTAEDVAGLDLLDTELVVLSACDTGLGAIHFGEGVFGLRRAFIVAGAKTLVMSLWKVPDLATAFLMDRFYDNLLTRGLDRDLALSQAQRATRDVTVAELRGEWLTPAMIEQLAAGNGDARRRLQELAQKPDDHRPFAPPLYWGAFICQGDPAPLPAASATD
jgi:tetratricopeptide (TPR) repeat protein/CHAT domain-containing protein